MSRYAEIELTRPADQFLLSLSKVAHRTARDEASGIGLRYEVGSRFWYRVLGAWSSASTVPLTLDVEVVQRESKQVARVRLVADPGFYLAKVPRADRLAEEAFIYWIAELRRIA